jgi:penicillin-binding protein 2
VSKRLHEHALFIGFAPEENPQIAVAIIVENGQHGGSMAAPIARKVFDAYLLGPDGKLRDGVVQAQAQAPAGAARDGEKSSELR